MQRCQLDLALTLFTQAHATLRKIAEQRGHYTDSLDQGYSISLIRGPHY